MCPQPTVSVIIPVFNGELYITQAINSVLNQTYTDIEIIIVDDGSTDNTKNIINNYTNKNSNIRSISCTNSGGPATPKNIGIEAAHGKYICFLDHDDLYDENRTKILVEALDDHPEWIAVFHDLRFIDENGKPIFNTTYLSGPDFLGKANAYLKPLNNNWFECSEQLYIYQSLQMGAPHTQSILIAKNRLPKNSISFNAEFIIGEDIDLWIRLSLLGKMGFLNKPLSSYRQHSTSITTNNEKKLIHWLNMHKHNFERIKGKFNIEQIKEYKLKISNGFNDLGYLYYKNQLSTESRAAYFESIQWTITKKNMNGYIKTYIPKKIIQLVKRIY